MFKVFIVDDEPFIIEGLYDIVDWAKLGMEIVGHAENGAIALEAMKVTPADILITDISMPVMSGLDLIRHVRAVHPELKVIVLSGYNEFDYLKEGMALGIENYLLKPINLEEFKGTLRTVAQKLNVNRSELALNEQSMRILRDNVMYRWLQDQISPKEFQERADLLGIELDQRYVQVSILRAGHSMAEVFDSVMNQLSSSENVVPFRDMDGDIVLVFNADDVSSCKEDAERISDNLRLLLSPITKFVHHLAVWRRWRMPRKATVMPNGHRNISWSDQPTGFYVMRIWLAGSRRRASEIGRSTGMNTRRKLWRRIRRRCFFASRRTSLICSNWRV